MDSEAVYCRRHFQQMLSSLKGYRSTMLKFQRKVLKVQKDLRQKPRVEFHTPAIIIGSKEKAKIVDFSLGGFYVQVDHLRGLKIGQHLNLAFRLPFESQGLMVKVKILRVEMKGFACQFVDKDPELDQVLERGFDFLSGTLPLE
jgi:hypothetical protein